MIVGLFLCTFSSLWNAKKIKIFTFLLPNRAKSSWSKQMSNGEQILRERSQACFWQRGLMVPEVTLPPLPGWDQPPLSDAVRGLHVASSNSLLCSTWHPRCRCMCVSSRGSFWWTCALMGCREQYRYSQSLTTHVSNRRFVETWKPVLPGEVERCLQPMCMFVWLNFLKLVLAGCLEIYRCLLTFYKCVEFSFIYILLLILILTSS